MIVAASATPTLYARNSQVGGWVLDRINALPRPLARYSERAELAILVVLAARHLADLPRPLFDAERNSLDRRIDALVRAANTLVDDVAFSFPEG